VAGHPGLVERERELDRLRLVLRDAGAGRGGVAMLEAPAGHGKTALLHAMRREAGAAGFLVLAARGAALERSFGYGLVRQLLEGEVRAAGQERRERLFAGAARLAEPVFGASGDEAAASDPSHTRLHGLYWLIANLAGEQPVLLLVDDAHWGDAASLRALGMLARRLDDLPVALAVAARPAEPDAEQDLLEELSTAGGGGGPPAHPQLRRGPGPRRGNAGGHRGRGVRLRVLRDDPRQPAAGLRARADAGAGGSPRAGRRGAAARRAVPGTIARTVVSRLRRLSPDALAVAGRSPCSAIARAPRRWPSSRAWGRAVPARRRPRWPASGWSIRTASRSSTPWSRRPCTPTWRAGSGPRGTAAPRGCSPRPAHRTPRWPCICS
jgi:hypothetical protein